MTIKARPILVESKDYVEGNIGLHIADNSLQIMQRKILGNKFFDTKDGSPAHGIVIPQQLILISLDPDEKIEVGDMIYNKFNNSTFNHIHIQSTKHTDISDKKVIALQSQIPMTYIHQFIEEYNNNSVKDVDIEMVEYCNCNDSVKMKKELRVSVCSNCKEWLEPKLTNGFVTIVKERLFNQSDIDKLGIKLPDINFKDDALQNPNTILYTEEEALDLLFNYSFSKGGAEEEYNDIEKWFEQNKKK